MLLHTSFFEICRDPGIRRRLAVRHDGRDYSYGQLLARSEEISAYLRMVGVGRGAVVAVMVTRGFDAVAAVYGIMAVGAVYMPVDPSFPRERVAYMLGRRPVNEKMIKDLQHRRV